MITTTEDSRRSLIRLMTWLSPAFPIGAFSYSHGLEWAIVDGTVHDRGTLVDWLDTLVARGSAWNDAVLLAQAWRTTDCADVSELAVAMAGSRERAMETALQGAAFAEAVSPWFRDDLRDADALIPYPVAVGQAAAGSGIELEAALVAYLHAFTSNLVQAAVRLVPLGQRDGVAAIAALETTVLDVAARASRSSLEQLGSSAFLSDIAAMRHEIQYSRVFRS